MSEKSDLIKEYKKLAKRANARLLALEKLSKQKHFGSVLNWSYRRAQFDIKQQGGAKRFKTSVKEDINIKTLSAMRNDIYNFLNSPSSTKTGIIKNYKEKTDTFNKKFGTDWNWEEMSDYFEKGGKEIFEEKFSSSTALDVLGVFRKNKTEIKKVVDDFNRKNKITDKDLTTLIDNLKDNVDENGNKILDWKMKKAIEDLLSDKEFSIEKFL